MDIDELIKLLRCGDASHEEQEQAADEIERLRKEAFDLRGFICDELTAESQRLGLYDTPSSNS